MTFDTEKILQGCKNGESKSFKELYNLYAKAMFNISVRILNNKNEAEDVLQESFLKAFQNIHVFDKQAAFGGWLKRVVINKSIDVIRKQKETIISLDELVDIRSDDAETKQEEDAMDYDVEMIKESIQKLSDGYRIVLTLYLFEEFTHKEIAATLNISEGTSKSQYNRAKKKLIEFIQLKNKSHVI